MISLSVLSFLTALMILTVLPFFMVLSTPPLPSFFFLIHNLII